MLKPQKYAVQKSGNNIPLLEVWSIADFGGTEREEDFTFNGDVAAWARRDNPAPAPRLADMSALENVVRHRSPFVYSEEAHEFYQTPLETDPVNASEGKGTYSSVNVMLMNGDQREHYHPDFYAGEYANCSVRIGIVIPALNTEFNELSGLNFQITEIKDPALHFNDKTVRGQATDSYKVHFPPGHIGVMLFRDGAHKFQGSGLVVSIHPLDVNPDNQGNTYDANTVGMSWDRSASNIEPEEIGLKPLEEERALINVSIDKVFPDIMRLAEDLARRVVKRTDHKELSDIDEDVSRLKRDLRDILSEPRPL